MRDWDSVSAIDPTNPLVYIQARNREFKPSLIQNEIIQDIKRNAMRNDIQNIEDQKIKSEESRPVTFLTVVLVLTWVADQLDATVSLDRGKGPHFTVRFRHEENQ